MGTVGISRPTPITDSHLVAQFTCGRPALDDWLKTRARAAEARSARTYVVCEESRVVGYYCLAAGGVLRGDVPSKLRRNMPDTISVMVLGRLAVDQAYQGRKIAAGMLSDAMLRTLEFSRTAGVRALLVHAIDESVVPFYLQYGFLRFPEGAMTLFLPVETMASELE